MLELLRDFTKMSVTVHKSPLFINPLYIPNKLSNSYTFCILSNVVEIYNNFSERNEISNCFHQHKAKMGDLNSTDPCKSIETDITKLFRLAGSKSRNMPRVVKYLKMREQEPSRIPVKKAVKLMSKNKHRRQT